MFQPMNPSNRNFTQLSERLSRSATKDFLPIARTLRDRGRYRYMIGATSRFAVLFVIGFALAIRIVMPHLDPFDIGAPIWLERIVVALGPALACAFMLARQSWRRLERKWFPYLDRLPPT